MKKKVRDKTAQLVRAKHSDSAIAGPKIIYGSFHQAHGKTPAIVRANNIEYVVSDVKSDIKLPIVENSNVKALVHNGAKKGQLEAKVLRVYDAPLSLKERISRILKDANVEINFSDDVLREAAVFKEVSKDEIKRRRDLTKITLCTIDGESAKDFDDAVFAEQNGKAIDVVVAIADVSHYVKENTALDREAIARGTSIYYPGHCVPMLPESLSNGLCSLKPHVNRLAIAVSFSVGPLGGIMRPRIDAAVIKSAARLTYNHVQAFYNNEKGVPPISAAIKDSLLCLQKAAHSLRKARERRGAIDFDVVESIVALDDNGEPMAIHPQERLDSHRIIEDLMVATNEIVAEFFAKRKLPAIYRVHESPDEEKLAHFLKTAQALSVISHKYEHEDFSKPKAIQHVMAQYQNSIYKDSLNSLMLRSMMQARYSEKNLMHFGLASKAYLHFTSPIRRYADLIVHRQLRYFLFSNTETLPEKSLSHIAGSITEKEIRATDLERKIARLHAATFMKNLIGQDFDANVVAVTEFGMFVRVAEYHVEGLVHISAISRSHVNFVPEKLSLVVTGSNTRYMVGQQVRVKLNNVNIERGHIDFELIKEDGPRPKPRRQKRNYA